MRRFFRLNHPIFPFKGVSLSLFIHVDLWHELSPPHCETSQESIKALCVAAAFWNLTPAFSKSYSVRGTSRDTCFSLKKWNNLTDGCFFKKTSACKSNRRMSRYPSGSCASEAEWLFGYSIFLFCLCCIKVWLNKQPGEMLPGIGNAAGWAHLSRWLQ